MVFGGALNYTQVIIFTSSHMNVFAFDLTFAFEMTMTPPLCDRCLIKVENRKNKPRVEACIKHSHRSGLNCCVPFDMKRGVNTDLTLLMSTRILRATPTVDCVGLSCLVDIRVFPLVRVIVGPLSMVTYVQCGIY